jgi:hypothetical protein
MSAARHNEVTQEAGQGSTRRQHGWVEGPTEMNAGSGCGPIIVTFIVSPSSSIKRVSIQHLQNGRGALPPQPSGFSIGGRLFISHWTLHNFSN